jgi:penicillin-binding protein 1B
MVVFVGYLLVMTGMVVWAFEVKLKRWPLLIHSDAPTVRTGDDVRSVDLMERLERLGYVETSDPIPLPGRWTATPTFIRLCLAHCPVKGVGIASGPVEIGLDLHKARSIRLMRSNEYVDQLTIEPELMQILTPANVPRVLCRPLSFDQINPKVVDAVVLTEDDRFFSHWGIDVSSMLRALKANVEAKSYVQGGSTITQQLMRMTLLHREKTLWRKFNEILMALLADAMFSKERILTAYLNRVYLGQWGAFPVAGIAEGSRLFFGLDQSELDASQAAFIAAIIRAPNVLRPDRRPERVRSRRDAMLERMLTAGKISRKEYEIAINRPIDIRRPAQPPVKASAFLALVKDRIQKEIPAVMDGHAAQDIITSLDPILQKDAETVLRRMGKAGEDAHLILANAETGFVSALVAPAPDRWQGKGGNLETLLPIAAIPALTPDKQGRPRFTLTSRFFPGEAPGPPLTLRECFHKDRRLLTARLVAAPGPAGIASALRDFQVEARADGENNIIVEPISPMELARVYSLIAMMGNAALIEPGLRTTAESPLSPKRITSVASPAIIFMVNYMMKDAGSLAQREATADGAWKVASVNAVRDAEGIWSIAIVGSYLLVVRVPGQELDPTTVTKMTAGLLSGRQSDRSKAPPLPDGLVFQKTCAESGFRATSLCPRVIRESFVKGSQPSEWCPIRHQ